MGVSFGEDFLEEMQRQGRVANDSHSRRSASAKPPGVAAPPAEIERGEDGRVQRLRIGEIPASLNQWYSGMHWSKRKRQKDRWSRLTKEAATALEPVEQYPVSIEVTCTFGHGSRSYDASNLAAGCKLIEDGLQKAGIIENDSRKYVESVTLKSRKDHGEDRTEVAIIEPKQ